MYYLHERVFPICTTWQFLGDDECPRTPSASNLVLVVDSGSMDAHVAVVVMGLMVVGGDMVDRGDQLGNGSSHDMMVDRGGIVLLVVDRGSIVLLVVDNWSGVLVVMDWGSDDLVHGSNDLVASWLTVNHSVEAIVVVSSVLNYTVVTVSIEKAVGSVNNIAITALVLLLDVSGVFIVNGVGEIILGRSFVFHVLHKGGLEVLDHSWLMMVHRLMMMVITMMVLNSADSGHKGKSHDELKEQQKKSKKQFCE